MVSNMMPDGAKGMAAFVMLYSFVNLIGAIVVGVMNWRHVDHWGIITVASMFVTISILASIIQQFHYIFAFRPIKQAAFDYAQNSNKDPSFALVGTFTTLDTALYLIQFYCYQVLSLLFVFWVSALFRSAWRVRIGWIDRKDHLFSALGKTVSIVLPALFIGVSRSPSILNHPIALLIMSNILLAGGVAVGMILLILVLYKYITIRQRLDSQERSGCFARIRWRFKFSVPDESTGRSQSGPMSYGYPSNNKRPSTNRTSRAKYDKWLIFRFSICFTILCIMQIFLIFEQILRVQSNTTLSQATAPDFTVGAAMIDEAVFMPGVTTGLLIFMVFGTTAPFRAEYARWLATIFCCGARRRTGEEHLGRSDSVVRLTNVNPIGSQIGQKNDWQDGTFNPMMSSGGAQNKGGYTVTIESRPVDEGESPSGSLKRNESIRSARGGKGGTADEDQNTIFVQRTITTNHS